MVEESGMKTSVEKRMVLAVAGLLVLGCICPVAHAADNTAALPNVNLELTDVDAKMAIKMLFDSVGRNYATDQDVQGTIPSLRIGTRVLLPVKALQDWIAARLVEDQQRYAAPWSSLRAYTSQATGPSRRRRPGISRA